MTWISNPVIRYRCAGCAALIERQVSARNAHREIDQLRDGPALYCAECWMSAPSNVDCAALQNAGPS